MKTTILALAMIALLWQPNASYADTIYSWKDKDGSLRFSDEPPPEGVSDYQATPSEATRGSGQAPINQRRASYDAMVQKATSDAARSREDRENRESAAAAEKKRIAEEKRNARLQAQRKQIEQQIEAIKNRAVSPTMPNGMKQAQIEALQKELKKLGDGADTNGTTTEKPGKTTEEPANKY